MGHGDAWENHSPSDFFRRHPVNCGIIPCQSRKERGKQALSNLKSKKLCNLSHLRDRTQRRSEEHTSELQSLAYLVCRLLLEKKKKHKLISHITIELMIAAPHRAIDTHATRLSHHPRIPAAINRNLLDHPNTLLNPLVLHSHL